MHVDAVVDEHPWRERTAQIEQLRAAFVVPRRLPFAVEPQHCRTVVRHDLGDLRVQVAFEAREVRAVCAARLCLPRTPRQVVRVMPVHDRVVEAEHDAVARACGRELLADVAAVLRVHDVPVRLLAVEQAEAVVVFARQHEVAHARGLCRASPCVGVERDRVPLCAERLVLLDRDTRAVADPFAVVVLAVPRACWNRVEAPMHEHAKARVAPPRHAFVLR